MAVDSFGEFSGRDFNEAIEELGFNDFIAVRNEGVCVALFEEVVSCYLSVTEFRVPVTKNDFGSHLLCEFCGVFPVPSNVVPGDATDEDKDLSRRGEGLDALSEVVGVIMDYVGDG